MVNQNINGEEVSVQQQGQCLLINNKIGKDLGNLHNKQEVRDREGNDQQLRHSKVGLSSHLSVPLKNQKVQGQKHQTKKVQLKILWLQIQHMIDEREQKGNKTIKGLVDLQDQTTRINKAISTGLKEQWINN